MPVIKLKKTNNANKVAIKHLRAAQRNIRKQPYSMISCKEANYIIGEEITKLKGN